MLKASCGRNVRVSSEVHPYVVHLHQYGKAYKRPLKNPCPFDVQASAAFVIGHRLLCCSLSPAVNGGTQCLLPSIMSVEQPLEPGGAVKHARCGCIKLGAQYSACRHVMHATL